jgi:two-component system chemotaxis sensor kinase CheA
MQFDEIQRRSRELFRVEAAELLAELEAALLELEQAPGDGGLVHRVFRVMHTLKGSGATSGFQELSRFLHQVEDVYNAAREAQIAITPAIIDLTLRLGDAVKQYLAADAASAGAVLERAQPDLAALLTFLPGAAGRPAAVPAATPASAPAAAAATYHVRFEPAADVFRHGTDVGMFLDDLRGLGSCIVRADTSAIPGLADLDPENCHLRWGIELTTEAPESAIRDVFLFIDGECKLEITRVAETQPPTPAGVAWRVDFTATERTLATPGALAALWRDLERFGCVEVLARPAGTPEPGPGRWSLRIRTRETRETLQSAFVFLLDADPQIAPEPAEPPSPVAPESARPAASPAPAAPPARKDPAAKGPETLRVSADRLDRLVNLVGELVILRSQVSTALAAATNLPVELRSAAEALQSLSTEMRDVILNIRMMPIEHTFAKFRRLVRDLAKDLGKDVELAIEGGETEMDKTVLDALADPLMHLVRNSLDHGLEPAEARVAAGKSPTGRLRLRAEQRGDRVIVSVSDDGRGLDAAKIRAKAIARGLLAAEARPSEADLFQLIFLPGFSTADSVSQVSGRGVGLDVVRRQIEQLHGKVEVRSSPGRGAEFRLSLPLTLAIIEGLMVEIDRDRYILPLASTRETIELTRAQRLAGNGRNLTALRGEMVPYLRLRDEFAFASEPPELERVVIVEVEEQRLGLVVDRVIGSHQTVLKSLGWLGRQVTVFSGATVLGDGRIALILDVPALLAHHAEARTNTGMSI